MRVPERVTPGQPEASEGKASPGNAGDDRSPARYIGLFLVLVILINGLLVPRSLAATGLLGTFYLAFSVHTCFTLYDGRFSAGRTLTWSLLIGAWVVSQIAAFFSFTVPAGQLAFWLAQFPIVGMPLGAALARGAAWLPPLGPVVLLLFLGLDVAVMHGLTRRPRSMISIGITEIAASVAALILGVAGFLAERLAGSREQAGTAGSFPIIPPWQVLPFYAVLRSIPNKLIGLLVTLAAMLLPLIWPWMGADVLRTGARRRVWAVLCAAFALVWIALAYLGSRTPEPPVILASQVLAAGYFAFFLVAPPVLRALARK